MGVLPKDAERRFCSVDTEMRGCRCLHQDKRSLFPPCCQNPYLKILALHRQEPVRTSPSQLFSQEHLSGPWVADPCGWSPGAFKSASRAGQGAYHQANYLGTNVVMEFMKCCRTVRNQKTDSLKTISLLIISFIHRCCSRILSLLCRT